MMRFLLFFSVFHGRTLLCLLCLDMNKSSFSNLSSKSRACLRSLFGYLKFDSFKNKIAKNCFEEYFAEQQRTMNAGRSADMMCCVCPPYALGNVIISPPYPQCLFCFCFLFRLCNNSATRYVDLLTRGHHSTNVVCYLLCPIT
jgi:hypothetical protein